MKRETRVKPMQWNAPVSFVVLFVALFLAGSVAAPAAPSASARTIQGIALESTTVLDVRALNERIKTVAAAMKTRGVSSLPPTRP